MRGKISRKKYKGNRNNGFRRFGRCAGKRSGKRQRNCRNSTPRPQPQPNVQNQAAQDQGTPVQPISKISGQDITSCQCLVYGAYIGNETRNIEFKRGSGSYMQYIFRKHVYKYGCAFLNSGGGSLLVGVDDNGIVYGVLFDHKTEDMVRQQVDEIAHYFHPPLFPHNYSLRFVPVVKPGEEEHPLKVLCLNFRAPPASAAPTLYQDVHGQVYMKRDGSVQGPLDASYILEWSRQMWAGWVQQLAQYLHEAMSEKLFLARQVQGLVEVINSRHQNTAPLQPQREATPSQAEEEEGEAEHEITSKSEHFPTSCRNSRYQGNSQHQSPESSTGVPSPPEDSQM